MKFLPFENVFKGDWEWSERRDSRQNSLHDTGGLFTGNLAHDLLKMECFVLDHFK